jgi:hypothetical protein
MEEGTLGVYSIEGHFDAAVPRLLHGPLTVGAGGC